MRFLQMIGILITAIALMELLPGTEVTLQEGTVLGLATDIGLDPVLDSIWVVVDSSGLISMVPVERLAG